nr:immunoglobulin light chain junction region [Macaca mulatta]MOV80158.1 immunoglobulin light chain junction region [Macaca mulatta]MOV80478.1 immunoglobulin light chain junction region [Macaca mulatta]MOV81294.1 immunoglobulin light chain junction region [Macaca mulatta]MOV81603.1 immunoglobulin light chain junction region [Macaca mulatta]
CLQGYSPPFTF